MSSLARCGLAGLRRDASKLFCAAMPPRHSETPQSCPVFRSVNAIPFTSAEVMRRVRVVQGAAYVKRGRLRTSSSTIAAAVPHIHLRYVGSARFIHTAGTPSSEDHDNVAASTGCSSVTGQASSPMPMPSTPLLSSLSSSSRDCNSREADGTTGKKDPTTDAARDPFDTPADPPAGPNTHKIAEPSEAPVSPLSRVWRTFKSETKDFSFFYFPFYIATFVLLYGAFTMKLLHKESMLDTALSWLSDWVDAPKIRQRIAAWDVWVDLGFAVVINELLEVVRFPIVMVLYVLLRPYSNYVGQWLARVAGRLRPSKKAAAHSKL